MTELKNQMVEYIRDNNRNKIGVMVAGILEDDPNRVAVGYALCHSKLDQFNFKRAGKSLVKDKDLGRQIAIGRALKWANRQVSMLKTVKEQNPRPDHVPIPVSIKDHLEKFSERVSRYYKDKELPGWFA